MTNKQTNKYPKIILRFSRVHDWATRRQYEMAEHFKKEKLFYPSPKMIERKTREFKIEWKKVEKRIFRSLEKLTNFSWHEERIVCYVRGGGPAMSDPLTVSLISKATGKYFSNLNDRLVLMLTHELIHCLFDNNLFLTNKLLVRLESLQRKEKNRIALEHVLIFVLEEEIIKQLGIKYPVNRIKKLAKVRSVYGKSLEIIEEIGRENILIMFKKENKKQVLNSF